MLKINFFNLIVIYNIKKALETAVAFIEAAEKHISALKCRVDNMSRNNNSKENSDENIIKVIRFEVKAAVHTAIQEASSPPAPSTTPRSWASIADSRPWGSSTGIAQEPRIVVSARRKREVIVHKRESDFF
jgi:hypothetical protein